MTREGSQASRGRGVEFCGAKKCANPTPKHDFRHAAQRNLSYKDDVLKPHPRGEEGCVVFTHLPASEKGTRILTE
jgi:hypothetical protein